MPLLITHALDEIRDLSVSAGILAVFTLYISMAIAMNVVTMTNTDQTGAPVRKYTSPMILSMKIIGFLTYSSIMLKIPLLVDSGRAFNPHFFLV